LLFVRWCFRMFETQGGQQFLQTWMMQSMVMPRWNVSVFVHRCSVLVATDNAACCCCGCGGGGGGCRGRILTFPAMQMRQLVGEWLGYPQRFNAGIFFHSNAQLATLC
jgi:hypothetical protein